MRNGEITLAYGAESLTVGLGDTEAVFRSPPDLGDVTIDVADAARPRGDGISFGTDFFGGRTVTLDLGIDRPTEEVALDALARIRRIWRADEVRRKPGAVATLTIRRAGRERVLFGRPRRFSPSIEFIEDGLALALVDFAATDDLFYSVDVSEASVNISPPLGGGFSFPLATPMATTESASSRSAFFMIAGDQPSWPVIEIFGPITNPCFSVVGKWDIELRTTVPAGATLTVDTQPWARTVLLGATSLPGRLTRASTRLSAAALQPGTYEFALSGISAPGTAAARVRWRDTFSSL